MAPPTDDGPEPRLEPHQHQHQHQHQQQQRLSPSAPSSPQASLLLLTEPPHLVTPASIDAAYRSPLASVISRLHAAARAPGGDSQPSGSALLIIALPCPVVPVSRSSEGRRASTVRWEKAQSLLARVYSLIAAICAEDAVPADIGAPGGVDARIVLINHGEDAVCSTGQGGGRKAGTTVPDLATFASKSPAWKSVYYLDHEPGRHLLQTYLGDLEMGGNSSIPKDEDLIAVEGGTSTFGSQPDAERVSEGDDDGIELYQMTCLGGTFDHLHPGHKLLLQATTLLTKSPSSGSSSHPSEIIIGISSDALLQKKKYAEQLQPWSDRASSVLSFLSTVLDFTTTAPTPSLPVTETATTVPLHTSAIRVRCVPLHDPFGPTVSEEDVDALVVSAETRGGGKAINDRRAEKGWKELAIYEIDVLDSGGTESRKGSDGEENFEDKISSTAIRRQRAEATKAVQS